MKNSFIVGILAVICFAQFALGQKKHMLSASFSGGVGSGMLVSMQRIETWNESLERLEERSFRYNGKAHFHYEYLFSRRFALGALVQWQSFRIPSFQISSSSEPGSPFNFGSEIESPQFTSVATMISLNWTPKHSLLPIGIKHTFAFGPKFYSMNHSKTYTGVYEGNFYDPTNPMAGLPDHYETTQFPESYSNNYTGISMMYGLTGSFAVAEDFYLQLGLDTHLDFVLSSSYERPTSSYNEANQILTPQSAREYMSYQFNTRNYDDELKNRDGWNVFMLRFGVMYNL
ncbi:MAG: hypothetical protein ACQERC_05795 [Bacteroidota bacterium]